jgi:hypothetical protein
MKLVRSISFALLLALLATQSSLAQSTGSDPGAQSPPPPQNPQPAPQSPLQEQPTGIAAEQQGQANQQRSGQLSQFETSGTGQDQALGEIRLMGRYTEVGGDQTRSFRDPGFNDLAEFNYFMDRRFGVTRRIQGLTQLRATNDYSIDPEHNSLQKAFVRVYGPKDEYVFGDTLVNYSRLVFNQNIKGASGSWLLGDKWKFGIVGGIFIDRWGSLYKDIPGRPYTAVVSGTRLQYSFTRDIVAGLNASTSYDITSSLPAADPGTAPSPAKNAVGSATLTIQKRNFRFDSEFAYAGTDFDRRDASGLCPVDENGVIVYQPCNTSLPQVNLGYQTDWGGRAEAQYRYGRLTLRGSFVRFQPNFASINARQVADLQDALARVSFEAASFLTVDGTFRRSNNDLRQQLPFETIQRQPEGRLIFHDLSFMKRGVFEMGYRQRFVNASDDSVDRYVRMPYAEFSFPISTTFLTVGYERRQAVDMINQSQTSNTNRYYAGLRGVYDFGGWHINPSFRYELERQSQRPELDDPAALDPLRLDYDSNRLGTASLLVEAPKWFIVELAFRDSSATIYGPTGYSRPAYRAQVTYKIANDENLLLIATFERNNNFYYTSPNFDERVSGLSFVWKFGKRGR